MENSYKTDKEITVTRYTQDLSRMKFKKYRKFKRSYFLKNNKEIAGFKIFAEKHCLTVKIKASSKLSFNFPEGKTFGSETLVLTYAKNINPALFGRE